MCSCAWREKEGWTKACNFAQNAKFVVIFPWEKEWNFGEHESALTPKTECREREWLDLLLH